MSENIKTCSFCELLKDVRARLFCTGEVNTTFECKAALVVEDSRRSEFGGKINYNPRQLNFCPECGRKLEKNELCW